MTSMMPDPQTPVMPMAAIASSKPGSSDQRSEPMTLKRGSSVSRSMRTRSIAPGRRALAAADLRALERGAGGARAGEQALLVAEHDLGIGAHVHQQGHFRGEIRPLGKHHARRIGADVTGDARQHIDPRVAMQFQIDDVGPQGERVIDRERERRAAQFHRIDAKQQVMHDRDCRPASPREYPRATRRPCAPRRPRGR